MVIDLTPVRAGIGPARLLDMVPGRSKAVFKTWLDALDVLGHEVRDTPNGSLTQRRPPGAVGDV